MENYLLLLFTMFLVITEKTEKLLQCQKIKVELILLMFSSVLSKDIKNVKNPKVENSPTQPALECPTKESSIPTEILVK